ncbi:MAG: hypothetical protein NTU61_05435 [Candidatus Altiarchaeota archaeon]|nr:hypothetical protein [Candidatus Altiarchaeota archaeon]
MSVSKTGVKGDRRVYAKELQDVSGKSGELLPVKDLSLAAVDRKFFSEYLQNAVPEHAHPESGMGTDWFVDLFRLRYNGPARNVHYIDAHGGKRVEGVEDESVLADFHVKLTPFFPNELLAELVRMHDAGKKPYEVYDRLDRSFRERGRALPDWFEVTNRDFDDKMLSKLGKSPDINLFYILVEARPFLYGMGVSRRLFQAALEYYAGKGHCVGTTTLPLEPGAEEPDVRHNLAYGIAYSRMAGYRRVMGEGTATPEKAFEYLERVKRGEVDDWSIGFHLKSGAKLVTALARGAPGDEESGESSGLAIYTPDALDRLLKGRKV